MISKNADKKGQVQLVSLDQLVPEDHILRKIDKYIDFSFIYELVEEKYCSDNGRPSIDPVTLIKIPVIQYMFGIKSMRQTIKEIEVNVAYRWFLGLDFFDPVPHFTTFGKNYKRRFEGTDLFEQIFTKILYQCMDKGLVDHSALFVDGTHVKAAANRKKAKKILVAKKTAKFYDEALWEEINNDREMHDKKPIDFHDDDDNPDGGSETDSPVDEKEIDTKDSNLKEQKISTTDPESGWYHKGEHKEVFAYSIQTACDKYGWILGFSVHPGNESDAITFHSIYEKIKKFNPLMVVADAGYKTPAIAKLLIDDNITPVFPYKRPATKEGFFKKYEYAYDEYYDCYICPNNEVLKYSTTNRDGYREYKSNPSKCEGCPYLTQCTLNKNHQKILTRHVWQDYMETCEDIRQHIGIKEIYDLRKETIERTFGTAKEHHGMRYTQEKGKQKMKMKVALTFACMNMKKLANMMYLRDKKYDDNSRFFSYFAKLFVNPIFA